MRSQLQRSSPPQDRCCSCAHLPLSPRVREARCRSYQPHGGLGQGPGPARGRRSRARLVLRPLLLPNNPGPGSRPRPGQRRQYGPGGLCRCGLVLRDQLLARLARAHLGWRTCQAEGAGRPPGVRGLADKLQAISSYREGAFSFPKGGLDTMLPGKVFLIVHLLPEGLRGFESALGTRLGAC